MGCKQRFREWIWKQHADLTHQRTCCCSYNREGRSDRKWGTWKPFPQLWALTYTPSSTTEGLRSFSQNTWVQNHDITATSHANTIVISPKNNTYQIKDWTLKTLFLLLLKSKIFPWLFSLAKMSHFIAACQFSHGYICLAGTKYFQNLSYKVVMQKGIPQYWLEQSWMSQYLPYATGCIWSTTKQNKFISI